MFSPQGKELERGIQNGDVCGKMTTFFTGEERLQGAPDDPVVARLERELWEHQYNMGLILIEKQELSLKLEEVTEALAEAKAALRNEHSGYLNAISDIENREEKLRNALGVERQCVHDLEEALHEMRSKYAEIKFSSDSKLAEANALVSSIEEKSLEVEAKLHAADAREDALCYKISEVEKKEAAVNHMEEKLAKRELGVDKRLKKIREKEVEYESKFKALQDRVKSVQLQENMVEKEKCVLLAFKAELQSEKDVVEQNKARVREQQFKILEQIETLNVAKEERSEFVRLQAELKNEKDQCRLQKELLLKESEDLRHQREIFERNWEELDQKKSEVEAEINKLRDQQEKMEKLQYSEDEKLRKERLASEEYVSNKLAALETAKESYTTAIEYAKLAAKERIESEKSQMLRDYKLQQQEIEKDMQQRQHEMKNRLRQKEKLIEENKESEENYLREVIQQEKDAMKLERKRLDREKQEVSENQKRLEIYQFELHKDIDDLVSLSKKMKIQREQFIRERECFIEFVEKHKSCEKCGKVTSEFVIPDLQPVPEGLDDSKLAALYLKDGGHANSTGKKNDVASPVAASGSPVIGGTVSWLQKCTSKIRFLSPLKTVKPVALDHEEAPKSEKHLNPSKSLMNAEQSNVFAQHDADEFQDDAQTDKTKQVRPGNSQKSTQNGTGKTGKRKPKITRTRSVKAVVEDAKNFIGEHFENSAINTENSLMESENRGEYSLGEETHSRNGRKRTRKVTSSMELDDDDESEGHSNSWASYQRKRRQKAAPAVPVSLPSGNRYNLRRRRTASANGQPTTENENKESEETRGKFVDAMKFKPTPVSSFGSIRNDGGSIQYFQFQKTVDANGKKENMVETTVFSQEANRSVGGANQSIQNVSGTPRGSLVEEGSSTDEDEAEFEQPLEVSIGKKLWTFLTT